MSVLKELQVALTRTAIAQTHLEAISVTAMWALWPMELHVLVSVRSLFYLATHHLPVIIAAIETIL